MWIISKRKLTKSLLFVCTFVVFLLLLLLYLLLSWFCLFVFFFPHFCIVVSVSFVFSENEEDGTRKECVNAVCTKGHCAILCMLELCWELKCIVSTCLQNILRLHLFQLSTFPCGWTCVQSQVMVILFNQIRHQWLHWCTDTK